MMVSREEITLFYEMDESTILPASPVDKHITGVQFSSKIMAPPVLSPSSLSCFDNKQQVHGIVTTVACVFVLRCDMGCVCVCIWLCAFTTFKEFH